MTWQPFLDDPAHARSLDGQRFVVLRVGGAVAREYVRLQQELRAHLVGADVSYPAQPHVTLAGVAAGSTLTDVQAIVETWSRDTPPLRVALDKVSVFGPPFQIVLAQVQRSAALAAALVDLRARLTSHGLTLSTVTPPERWIFHLSLVYGARLDADAWEALVAFSERLTASLLHGYVERAEIVAFDDGVERSGGAYGLRGADATVVEIAARRVLEGRHGLPFLVAAGDVVRLVETCVGSQASDVLLYASNLPPAFFDLSSGDAGAILQKLAMFGIRLAVVRDPVSTQFSTRFGEAVAEERDRGRFAVCDTREAALDWLARTPDQFRTRP